MSALLCMGSMNNIKRFQAFTVVGGGHFAHLLRSSKVILLSFFHCRVYRPCDSCIMLINTYDVPYV